jgi:hypothetical protein
MATSLLQELFSTYVPPCFRSADVTDKEIQTYVTGMLVRFANAEVASKTNIADQAIEDIGEMIAKSDPIFGTASCFEEERRVRQYVGDAALFFSGLYPGSVHYRQRRQQTVQTTDELIRVGKESYYIVSQFDVFEYRQEARLFSNLASRFDDCVRGLSLVRERLLIQ